MRISLVHIAAFVAIATFQVPLLAEPSIMFADQLSPGQSFDGNLRKGELNIYFWRNSEGSPLGLIRCSKREVAGTQKALVSTALGKARFFESESAVITFERSILKDEEEDTDNPTLGTIIAIKAGDQAFLLNDAGNGEGRMLLRVENVKVKEHQAGFLVALNRALKGEK